MDSLLDPQTDKWQAQRHKREQRKAQLLRQGRLLMAAYERGDLPELLAKLRDKRQDRPRLVNEKDLEFYQVF